MLTVFNVLGTTVGSIQSVQKLKELISQSFLKDFFVEDPSKGYRWSLIFIMNKGPLFPFHDVNLNPKNVFLNKPVFSTSCQIHLYLVYVILLFTDPISYSYALFQKCEMWWKDYLMHKKETHHKETCSFMEVYTFIQFLFTKDVF